MKLSSYGFNDIMKRMEKKTTKGPKKAIHILKKISDDLYYTLVGSCLKGTKCTE